MSGCGGKMSKGGKVTPVKKMKSGGSSGPCPKGYHLEDGICTENMFHTLSSKIGVGTTVGGMIGVGAKAISDAIKAKKERKKAQAETKSTEEVKRKGGAKYKTGGIAKQTIVAFPGYNARTDTMKKGGATKNAKLAAVAAPKNKVTRADVLTRILKNKKK